MKVQFIIKKRGEYGKLGEYDTIGLYNATTFISKYLTDSGVENIVSEAIDGNSIDKLVTEYNPDKVFIEALWITPDKFRELLLIERHQKREWIVRLHSKLPFLSQEGIAIDWIKQYDSIGIIIAPNSFELSEQLENIGIPAIPLNNIYYPKLDKFPHPNRKYCNEIHIGCMGAIRPMKNQLLQAFAAIDFAEKIGKQLYFYINANRTEQNGNNNLKNIRALFQNTSNRLIEVDWLSHDKFLKLISQLDLGMQVSFTESFNIVAADFVYQNVPILVGEDISWMPRWSKVSPTDYKEITNGLSRIYKNPKCTARKNNKALEKYNINSTEQWSNFLKY